MYHEFLTRISQIIHLGPIRDIREMRFVVHNSLEML